MEEHKGRWVGSHGERQQLMGIPTKGKSKRLSTYVYIGLLLAAYTPTCSRRKEPDGAESGAETEITAPPKPAPAADAASAEVEASLEVARMPPWATLQFGKSTSPMRRKEKATVKDAAVQNLFQFWNPDPPSYLDVYSYGRRERRIERIEWAAHARTRWTV